MKNIIKFLSIIFLTVITFSCQDDEKVQFTDHIQADDLSPYVRIILENTTVDSSVLDTATINGTVSAPSNNVASWDVSVGITGSMTTAVVPLATVTTFPSDISFSVTEIATALGIVIADIQPADVIQFTGTSTGLDGTVLTAADLANDLAGQPEQRQAYDFSVTVFCAPVAAPFVGEWLLDLQDSYGDGWDGAFITATVDGLATNYTFSSGFAASFPVDIPSGTASLVWSYTSGSFESEHTFTITDPSGTVFGPFDGGPGIPFCFL